MNDEKRAISLEQARDLGFNESHYEEAVRLVRRPSDSNEFIKTLMQVGDPAPDASIPPSPFSGSFNQKHLNYVNDNILSETGSTSGLSNIPSSTSDISSLDGQQLKKVYIDGSNVAKTHGKNLCFSWIGVKLSVDWFYNRGHRVKVFVPADKQQLDGAPEQQQQELRSIINYLNKLDALVTTPTGHNDDYFIIEAARRNNGIIVSNDLYRDEKRYDEELKEFIRFNRLPYIFVDDLFIPAEDPLGRSRRPFLEEFLRIGASQLNLHQRFSNSINRKLDRAKSFQKYPQRNDSLNCNHNGRNKTPVHFSKSHPVNKLI